MKKWLIQKFLPAWCREELIAENKRLAERIDAQSTEIKQLRAYISGMERAMHSRQKVYIQGSAEK